MTPERCQSRSNGRSTPVALAAIGLAVLVVLIGAPLVGWPRVVRLPAVLVPALALALLVPPRQYWRQSPLPTVDWQPPRRLVWSMALVVGLLLFWYVWTRFRSGEINAIDFTVYYDRPCFQTVHGRPLLVETSDTPALSNRSELADHAYWGMLIVCAPYALHPSPLWLHALSAIAIVAGSLHVLRISQRLGAGGILASATALAFVLNDNTARTLNYGFHPEVLYAWFIPWMIDAGLRGARASFLAAMLASVLVKEDACLPLFAASVALAFNGFRTMTRTNRFLFLVLPTVVALASLGLYYGYVVPLLSGESRPTYAIFLINFLASSRRSGISPLLGSRSQVFKLARLPLLPVKVADVRLGRSTEGAEVVVQVGKTMAKNPFCTLKIKYFKSDHRAGAPTFVWVVVGAREVRSTLIVIL